MTRQSGSVVSIVVHVVTTSAQLCITLSHFCRVEGLRLHQSSHSTYFPPRYSHLLLTLARSFEGRHAHVWPLSSAGGRGGSALIRVTCLPSRQIITGVCFRVPRLFSSRLDDHSSTRISMRKAWEPGCGGGGRKDCEHESSIVHSLDLGMSEMPAVG